MAVPGYRGRLRERAGARSAPIAEATLGELTHLAERRLGAATAGAVSAALRQLAELG
jgi:hypothetical protein